MFDVHFTLIGWKILTVVHEKPDLPEPCRLIDHVTDDDRREGIRRYFADTQELDDETLELLLKAYKEWEEQKLQAHRMATSLVESVVGGLW